MLVEAYDCRAYAGPADLEAIVGLIAARPAVRRDDFPNIADLQEMMGVPEIRACTRLWEDAQAPGRAAGLTILQVEEGEARLILEVAEPEALDSLGGHMLEWAVGELRANRSERTVTALTVACRDDDHARRALLERHGLARQETHTLHLARPLGEPIPAPQLPPGFTLRRGERDAEAWVALHRAAFGSEHMTVDYRRAMVSAPAYDPELDLAAVAPDGTLAAYCVCSISQEENAMSGRRGGFTDPVATHPAYRRRGLARALLLTGLRDLRQRGMDTARLGTSSENVAMQAAAISVGYRVQARTLFFSIQL